VNRLAGLAVAACAVLLVLATPAWAHTGLESSDPADGETVEEPLDAVTLTFNRPIELAGDGVEILDAAGALVASDTEVDAEVVTVHPAEALDGGRYGVRWAVRSGDGHPVRGTFGFEVPATASTRDAGAVAEAAPAPAPAPAPSAANAGAAELDRALEADPTARIRGIDQALRAILYCTALGAVGLLVFLIAVWEGPRSEARRLTLLTSRVAVLTALLVIGQVVVGAARSAGGWSHALDALGSTLQGGYVLGEGLRLAGAVALAVGLGGLRRALCASAPPIAGAAVDVLVPPPAVAAASGRPRPLSAGRRMAAAPVAVVGALSILASFALVGHAATAEPRVVALGAVVGHVSAAAVWGGGLLGLVITLWARQAAGRPARAGLISARFSVAAAVGVGFAAAAGVALAAIRLDAVSALWTTAYGRALLAKVAVVAVVGLMGAYNHFIVVPALREDPEHRLVGHLRWLGLIELGLLVMVAGLTSALVGLAG
jgi:copper transport protein